MSTLTKLYGTAIAQSTRIIQGHITQGNLVFAIEDTNGGAVRAHMFLVSPTAPTWLSTIIFTDIYGSNEFRFPYMIKNTSYVLFPACNWMVSATRVKKVDSNAFDLPSTENIDTTAALHLFYFAKQVEESQFHAVGKTSMTFFDATNVATDAVIKTLPLSQQKRGF